jgi:hypothetical protein
MLELKRAKMKATAQHVAMNGRFPRVERETKRTM